MADKTGIEWTDATWNPLAGCSLVSPGCTNCYAMGHANRLLDKPGSHYEGTTRRVKNKAVWTGKVNKAPDHIMTQPLRWTRPRTVFVNSMSDLFHEDVPDEWIDEIFAIMAMCPQHTFQILTKRPARMLEYCKTLGKHHSVDRVAIAAKKMGDERKHPVNWFYELTNTGWALQNVWLGVSVEDDARRDRVDILREVPAAVRFLSMEPLIGPVDDLDLSGIDWVIVGGESGAGARPMHPDWVRSIREQCQSAGVAFFFKQWGQWAPLLPDHEGRRDWSILDFGGGLDIPDDRWPDENAGEIAVVSVGKGKAGRTLDGRTWDDMPERKAA